MIYLKLNTKKNDFSIKEKYGSFLKTIIYLKTKNKKNYKILLDLNDIKYKNLKFLELIDYTITEDLRYFIYLIDETGDEKFKLYINKIENDLSLSCILILNDINSYSFLSKHDLLFVSKAKNKILKESDISRRILFYDIKKLKSLYKNVSKNVDKKIKNENEENLKLLYLEKNSLYYSDMYFSKDKKILFIESGDHSNNEIKFISINKFMKNHETNIETLINIKKDIINNVAKKGRHFYILSNKDSDNKFIYQCSNRICDDDSGSDSGSDSDSDSDRDSDSDSDNKNNNMKIVYKPSKGRFISDFICFKDFMIVCEKYSCKSYLYLINNYDFSKKNRKCLVFFNNLNHFHINILSKYSEYNSKEFLYTTSSIGSPLKLYKYNTDTLENDLIYKKRLRGLQGENFVGKIINASLKDDKYVNTKNKTIRIPISYYYNIELYKKKSDFKNCPIYITGYGSYGSELSNSFSKMYPMLLKKGFVIVMLHIRGGGENGLEWYKGGKMLNKINSILDFQNGIKYISDYFNSKKIAVRTRSAGGIIIGNALNNLDGLIKVAIPEVPFVDCLTTLANTKLPLTKLEFTEFGDPNENSESFNNIMKLSPYENIKKKNYPHTYIIGGLNDYRVRYDEPTKYYFKMMEHNTSKKSNILLDINDYGHFGPSEPNEDITFISKIQLFILNNI